MTDAEREEFRRIRKWAPPIKVRTVLPHLDLFPSGEEPQWPRPWLVRPLSRWRGSAAEPFLSFRLAAPLAAHADAVKVGRRSSLAAYADVDRPHLDGGECAAMLGSSRTDMVTARY